MNLIQLIFSIIYRFVPIDKMEYAKLKDEIEQDWASVRTDKEFVPSDVPTKIKSNIKRFTEGPWARLSMPISYLVLIRVIQEWLNPKPDNEEESRYSD